ncbi:MAG: RNA methyltransferase [Nitrospirae bacterium]|nr:RNA methyltransferase [Nitrospirota bacterium]MCL5237844.1 RNA methyltransferase [Nitrospirota bacterium]
MSAWKDNLHFVLVGPREPGNIGASARAMKNMGFKKLCLVKPAAVTAEAKRLACNALDVLENAEVHQNLSAAVRDKAIVAGVARRTGRRRGLILPVEKGASRLIDIARDNKVALLFGREDRGLFNEEIEECGLILTVPSYEEQPSLNLSHAVMVVAYELSRRVHRAGDGNTGKGSAGFPPHQKLVSHDELSHFYERLSKTMKLLEYIPEGNRDPEDKIMKNLKFFIGRAGLTDWELKMLYGICSQVERKLGEYNARN